MTHFGDDLDNRFAVEALSRETDADITVDRTSAGSPVKGRINIDVGDETCSEPVTVREDGTVVIDHHYNSYPNTLKILQDCFDIYIPEQAVELADTLAENVDPLDTSTGLAIARYVDNRTLWELAENRALNRSLTAEEIEKYNLKEAVEEQKAVINAAVKAVNKGAFPEFKAVVVDKFIPAGSAIAYRLGYDIYISVQDHPAGGITFAVTSRPGLQLPESLINFGLEEAQKYPGKIFIKPDRSMIVAGGPKNPDFSLPYSKEEFKNEIIKLLEKDIKQQTVNKMTSSVKNSNSKIKF